MSPNLWPAMVPFDPETEIVPEALEALWSRAGEQGPALVLAVGAKAEENGWAMRTAVALATIWAQRGGRLVLADLSLAAPALHGELGEANTDGVADIFQFGASVRRMARSVPGHGFRYLPAGAYIPEPAAILRSAGWDHIIGQFHEDRATLLAYLPAAAEGSEDLIRRLGRALVLADPEEAPSLVSHLAGICTIEAVISPLAEAASSGPPEATSSSALGAVVSSPITGGPDKGAAEPEAVAAGIVAEEDSAPLDADGAPLTEPPLTPRRSRRSRRGVSVLLRSLLLVTVALGGWALLDDRGLVPDWAAAPAWLSLSVRATQGPAAGPSSGPAPMTSGHGDDQGGAGTAVVPGAAPAAEPVANALPYSVAVEAHQDFATAVERVAVLRRSEPGTTFYLTPIPNQGVVYYRLLAGPVADTAAAWNLMRRLVAGRHKTDLDPWSIRPTVWAYHLGDFPTEAAAAERSEELIEQRIPTYVVEVDYTSGPPRYRLFAGAYEGPAPAEVMAELLREAGIDAPLVRREGKASP